MVDRYAELYRDFRWSVPARYNIAQACCGQWAGERSRFALYWEDESGASAAYSFWDIQVAANRLSNALAGLGVKRGERVALILPQRPETAIAYMAIFQMGAIALPLSHLFGPDALEYRINHAEASIALVEPTTIANLWAVKDKLPTLRHVIGVGGARESGVLSYEELLQKASSDFTAADTAADDPALIIYTSGTESTPKGALLTHAALLWEYVSCLVDAQIASEDLILHALPLYHCAQLDCFLGPAIYVGATNIITSRPTPDNLLPLLERHHISSFFAPPTVWISLLRSPLFARSDLTSLRKAYYGASIMPVEVLREMQRRLPQVRLWNLYGQTEIAPVATVLKPEDQLRKPGSAGRPVLNVETRIVDESGAEVAVGEVGEIVHRSPQLIRGYYRDEERTRLAFEGDWFHSGDLARRDEEGYITIVDRRKDMIKSGGENVSSREVEETIYQLTEVAEVAVIGLLDPTWIEAVTAVVVLKEHHSITTAQIVSHCAARLSPFKVPKRVFFAEHLPKNPSGKVLKRLLRETCGDLGNDRK